MDKILASGIIAICKNTGRILLCRRNMEGDFPNHWGLFGGTFEDSDKTPKETAKREFKEETKYDGSYSISKTPICTYNDTHVTYYSYVGLFDDEFVPDVNGDDLHSQENVDYGWFELDKMPSQMIPALKDTFDTNRKKILNIIVKCKTKI